MISKRIRGSALRRVTREYLSHLRAFSPNARLYLSYVFISGAAMGVFRLLFNFYVLSLGYDEALLGNLITLSSLTALIAAIPMGYLADILGRKLALLISAILVTLSILAMVLWPARPIFYTMNVLSGLAQALAAVTMAPFLMENSREGERTYLFSFSFGLQTAVGSIGNWIGGYLPSWIAQARGFPPTSSAAYGGALLVVAGVALIGALPLGLIRAPRLHRSERALFAPLSFVAQQPLLLSKLVLPMLLTSIGAGLIMPFMNVFFRVVHHQSDAVIGMLFAWGSLAMGIGLMLAPPLADRLGKIQFVVITQGLSIPFLVLLGFAPSFWLSALAYYVRLALMNMGGPVYETFVMEHVQSSARATVASLVSMAWNFGWAFSPTISGWLQVHYGFAPPFLGTIILYSLSITLYWAFFWRESRQARPLPVIGD